MVAVLPPRTRPARAAPVRRRSRSRGVIDPLTALAVPAGPANLAPLSACGRTQRVFDGMRRYDVTTFPSSVGRPIEVVGQQTDLRLSAGPRCARQSVRLRTGSAGWNAGLEARPSGSARGGMARAGGRRATAGAAAVPRRYSVFGTITIEVTDATAFVTPLRAVSSALTFRALRRWPIRKLLAFAAAKPQGASPMTWTRAWSAASRARC